MVEVYIQHVCLARDDRMWRRLIAAGRRMLVLSPSVATSLRVIAAVVDVGLHRVNDSVFAHAFAIGCWQGLDALAGCRTLPSMDISDAFREGAFEGPLSAWPLLVAFSVLFLF